MQMASDLFLPKTSHTKTDQYAQAFTDISCIFYKIQYKYNKHTFNNILFIR